MMRGLFGNIVGSGVIREVPVAGEYLAEDRIQGLFDARRTNVPTRKVEFHNRHKSFGRVVDLGYGQ